MLVACVKCEVAWLPPALGSLFGQLPKTLSVEFTDRHLGTMKVPLQGRARVALASASDLYAFNTTNGYPNKPANITLMKMALINFLENEAFAGDKTTQEEYVKKVGFTVLLGELAKKSALLVPPGWLLAVDVPSTAETTLCGVSCPFVDLSAQTLANIQTLVAAVSPAQKLGLETILDALPKKDSASANAKGEGASEEKAESPPALEDAGAIANATPPAKEAEE